MEPQRPNTEDAPVFRPEDHTSNVVVEDPLSGNWVELVPAMADRAINAHGYRWITEDEINARLGRNVDSPD